jgi:hypothetical protein
MTKQEEEMESLKIHFATQENDVAQLKKQNQSLVSANQRLLQKH